VKFFAVMLKLVDLEPISASFKHEIEKKTLFLKKALNRV
jgi:hypothetical protein